MKEVVLTKPPYMNASELRIADMHSLLNIFNILIGELSMIEPKPQDLRDRSAQLNEEMHAVAREIKEGGGVLDLIPRIREIETAITNYLKEALDAESLSIGKAAISDSASNLESLFSVLGKRLDEFEMRASDPDVWVLVEPDVFRQHMEDVFRAIAKNSKGGYEIHFDSGRKGKDDYYVDLKIEMQRAGDRLWMPLRLLDILRDLSANARKYTPPGGKIAVLIHQDDLRISATIEDNGCGIPGDEIEKIAEFGYRARNVRHRPTRGGGFGLTKAVWLVTSWGGCVTVRSEVDAGTEVRLTVPLVDQPDHPETWTV